MKETLAKLRTALIPIYGKYETDAIIRLIFHKLKGWNLTDMLIHQGDELSDFVKDEIDGILKRLLNHEPIQYILGEARFHGLDFIIEPGVLIPRQETDELIDIIIDENKDKEDLKVLDLCTGSGCIAIALARNLPFSSICGVDYSEEAVKVAEENNNLLKTKVIIQKEDIFDWMPESKYDIIVSNPPYVMDKEALSMEKNVLDFEPHDAIFVPDDNPLIYYKRIKEIAEKSLNMGGRLYLEINPLKSEELKDLLEKGNFSEVTVIKDSSGKNRFIKAVLSD